MIVKYLSVDKSQCSGQISYPKMLQIEFLMCLAFGNTTPQTFFMFSNPLVNRACLKFRKAFSKKISWQRKLIYSKYFHIDLILRYYCYDLRENLLILTVNVSAKWDFTRSGCYERSRFPPYLQCNAKTFLLISRKFLDRSICSPLSTQ